MASILVTGASGGIGVEIARLAAADGHDLVLVARSGDALEAVAAELRAKHGVGVSIFALDLSDHASVPRLVAALDDRRIAIDVLVNNAGVGKLGAFATMDPAAIDGMVALNVAAVTALARALLPGMVARKHGRILNVASTAAFQPGPLMAVYYATKAYVMHWSLALSDELRGSGVTVTCLCPGPTRTGFQATAGMNGTALFKSAFIMTAARAAEIGYRAMLRGKPLVVAGRRNAFFAFCTRLVPRMAAGSIAKRLQAPHDA